MKTNRYAPYFVNGNSKTLIEFPVTVTRLLGKSICFFGGGYLRIFPYSLIKKMALKVQREGRPVVFYVHPREIDPEHPRLPMSFRREFKSYVNLETTEAKINRLLNDFEFTTFRTFIAKHMNGFDGSP